MTDWTAGYVADIDYIFGYYKELNPLRINIAFLSAGLLPPVIGTACELGFGQGMSANIHAAASIVQWTGTDFNPSQASFAQELARVANSGALLSDEAFEHFCTRSDLPDFDYIGLHGIWSWISDKNRTVIVDFISRKLKIGGVLYISYNSQPGRAAMVPMRDLLIEHTEVLGANGAGIVNRIDAALTFVDQLLETNPAFVSAYPKIMDSINLIKKQNRQYLSHEYFNRDWQPMAFSQMAHWMHRAKLQWACSANYLDAFDAFNLTAKQRALLQSIPDPVFRQTTRDFCVNQQFRRDYWVKGRRSITPLEQTEAIRSQRIMLAKPRIDVSLKITGSLGELVLLEAIYNPILEQLADHKPRTLGQLEQGVKGTEAGKALTAGQILQAVMVLIASETVVPVQDDAVASKVKQRTDRLNAHLMMKARSSNELIYLASPVSGGGVLVTRFCQLFLLARSQGHKQPEEWAQSVWKMLQVQGQRVSKEGKVIESAEGNLAELTAQAKSFAEKELPVLRALQIA